MKCETFINFTPDSGCFFLHEAYKKTVEKQVKQYFLKPKKRLEWKKIIKNNPGCFR